MSTAQQHFREIGPDGQIAVAQRTAERRLAIHPDHTLSVMAELLLDACVQADEKATGPVVQPHKNIGYHTEGDFAHVKGVVPKWGENCG